MSATSRSTPVRTLPRREAAPAGDDLRLTVRPIALLVAFALALSLLAGAFAGIVLFVAGLAGLAAYAAAHPHHPHHP